MSDLKRTRESLAFIDQLDVESPIAAIADASNTIRAAARRWVDLFEECENCDGTGEAFYNELRLESCASCGGRGFTLNRDGVDAAAGVIVKHNSGPTDDRWIAAEAIFAFLSAGLPEQGEP